MPFSPEEIASKDFLTTIRGYDKDEVRAFLRAIAGDYSAALEAAEQDASGPTGSNPYESLGEELASILQNAKETAQRIHKKAEEETAAMRQRAESESKSLRAATTNAAKRLTDEAEQDANQVRADANTYARDVRTKAERETEEKLRDATRRLEKLRSLEAKLKQRLYSLETALQSVRKDFESSEGEASDEEVVFLDASNEAESNGRAPAGRGSVEEASAKAAPQS